MGSESDPDVDLRVLCDGVKALEQNEVSSHQSNSYLRNRIRELESSERSLLLQLASAPRLPSMQHSQRLDHRLHMLREEVRTMTQDKEHGERVWRERLQRCQRQLKAKEEEMSRQSQYFENFKTQLQHKLAVSRDREQTLQNRIYALEKQLLDMTVSAATGTTAIGAVRITAGAVRGWEEQERLPSMRGEGEGEEERKEERRKQWQPVVETEREGGREGDEGKTDKDARQSSNESRLQGFILSLQEDLRVLLEREENGMTERRGLTEQLQEAQENGHFLGCQVEEMKAEVHQLRLSESSLMEEVEELREENRRLQRVFGDAANRTSSRSSAAVTGDSSVGNSGEVHQTSEEGRDQTGSSAVPALHHQAAAESRENDTEDYSSSAESETTTKKDHLSLVHQLSSSSILSLQSLPLTTETLGEFKLGTWCSRGILNLEESPSEESDALREAYRSLGLGEDVEALQEQRDRLEVALRHAREQLQVMAQENTRLKLQLRKEAEEPSPRERISKPETSDGSEDLTILSLAQDDLVSALNQENRALADRIQELLAHIELSEEENKSEETQLRGKISELEADRARQEQENQEQACLITELTKKTEDDLNTILDLQQRLEESEQWIEEAGEKLCGSQPQTEYTAAMSGSFKQKDQEESVDSLVESVLKKEEPQFETTQQPDELTVVSAPGSQHDHHNDHSSLQSSLNLSSLTDQVDQLIESVQSLKTEKEELQNGLNSLREQQREVTLSVQTQTEAKQQLTRSVWGLKEEKDGISQALAGLKNDRERLSRAVCGLKDEREQLTRSTSGLKEEQEQLTKSLSNLERENEKLLQSLSSAKDERDGITRSLQGLQTERDHLSQAVLNLREERDKLTSVLKCLKEQRDREQSSYALQEDRDALMKSVSGLREEKQRTELSISCLKREEERVKLLLQSQREMVNAREADPCSQTPTEGMNRRPRPHGAATAKRTGTGECQADDRGGNSAQEQSDLMREIDVLEAELKRLREELDKSHGDTDRLRSELGQSEARREEAERKAAQATARAMRLTDVANQKEEITKENASLLTQVKELQRKLSGLVREKTDALTQKAQMEELYNVLTAQLKAKTVALEELNSEYIALKRGQGTKDDPSAVLVSLRTRYNDVKAKYDALLKQRSEKDLDIAPLKAKLSCLVVKCQERNSLLAQMMKAMRRQGCADATLTQQVEQLLCDAALQDYTSAFTLESNINAHYGSAAVFAPGIVSTFQDRSGGSAPDRICSTPTPLVNKQSQTGLASESDGKFGEIKKEKNTFLDSSGGVTPTLTGTRNKGANSPVPASSVPERTGVQTPPSAVVPPLTESSVTTTAQVPPSASGLVQATSGPEKFGSHHSDMKGKSSLDQTRANVIRRLSSPEKILNLHEQLQKTLMSSYQAPASRGRGQQPRKSLSADPGSASQKQSLIFSTPQTDSLPVTTAPSPAKHTPAVTPTPVSAHKSKTLFNAVACRSASVTSSPSVFTKTHFNADKTRASSLSSSSYFDVATMPPSKAKTTSACGADATKPPKLSKKMAAMPAEHAASTAPTPTTNIFDSGVLKCSDANPGTTASSETTAPGAQTAPEADHLPFPKTNGAAAARVGLVFASSRAQSAPCSPERPDKSGRKSSAGPEKTKTTRPKPDAPAKVRSVEVIKTVGQSGLLIGWERPPLDELGCSNGTFVYGYRVFVDGDFHKSVMSSACTKCILENMDLSVPLHISVQTLGANGLCSDSVHTTYRTSDRSDHH